MNNSTKRNTALAVTVLFSLLATQTTMAQGSLQHSAAASANGLASVGHSLAGGAKLISGVAAVPFLIVGSIGHVSGEIGKDLADASHAPIGTPLPISDETVTSIPSPSQAMKVDNKEIEI